jgi:hypothetical protein
MAFSLQIFLILRRNNLSEEEFGFSVFLSLPFLVLLVKIQNSFKQKNNCFFSS